MRTYLYLTATTALALLPSAAFAGDPPAVPGPIAAVGAPALLLIAGTLLAVRYVRSRRK